MASSTRPGSSGKPTAAGPRGSAPEVLLAFLKLGLTSFGGPIAHLGYFRAEFVERRRWLDDAGYTDLVAMSQFLPGPASSKVGIALGLARAGWPGALAAWAGFTLPSALVLILFALGVGAWSGLATSGAIHGLQVAAVAVVAQAVWGMSKALCTDRPRALIAVAAALGVLALPAASGQVGVIVAGGIVGRMALRADASALGSLPDCGVSRRTGALLLAGFALLLAAAAAAASVAGSPLTQAVAVFYKAGALVFGGGHVVLPLLQAGVVPPGWIDNEAFVAGYGAAQAVPGPLFTFAAYLGATLNWPLGPWTGGFVALLAIFLPAFLLTAGALPFWQAWRRRAAVRQALGGVNAAVVGILAAALYDPVWTSAVRSKADFGLALAAFGLLAFARVSPVWVVAGAAAGGWALAAWPS